MAVRTRVRDPDATRLGLVVTATARRPSDHLFVRVGGGARGVPVAVSVQVRTWLSVALSIVSAAPPSSEVGVSIGFWCRS